MSGKSLFTSCLTCPWFPCCPTQPPQQVEGGAAEQLPKAATDMLRKLYQEQAPDKAQLL